jgi:hypothetical protein
MATGLIDVNITKPELANSFATGYRQAEESRNLLAQQKQQTEMSQFKLEQLKQDRDQMLQFQTQLKNLGHDPDLDKLMDVYINSGRPDYIKLGFEGKQKLKEQRAYAKLFPDENVAAPAATPVESVVRMPQAPAAMPAPTNALGSGMFGMDGATAPVNAMANRAAPAAPVNAMAAGPDQAMIAKTQQRISDLMRFAASNPGMANQATAQARIMQDQLELYSKRGPNKPAALQELEAYMAMPPEQKLMFEKLQKIKAPNVSATSTTTNSPTGKSLSEPVGKRVDASLAKAEGAAGLMENANMIREAINTGNIIAGPLAGPRTKFAQVLAAAGAGDKEKLQNTLSVAKGLAGLTLESRGELKGQGQVTDTETKLLERARSGDMELTLDELQQVVNVSQRLAKRLWENHQTLLKTMEKDPAAAGSIEYYRPTGPLAAPLGIGKSPAEQRKESARPSLDSIFGKPPAAR